MITEGKGPKGGGGVLYTMYPCVYNIDNCTNMPSYWQYQRKQYVIICARHYISKIDSGKTGKEQSAPLGSGEVSFA
jgi:hypothetical protein